jgi:hypothetical protein
MLAQLLAERTGRRPDDFEVRVTARVLTGAILEATLEWMRTNGRRGLVELVTQALDVLESGTRLSLRSAGVRRRARSAR